MPMKKAATAPVPSPSPSKKVGAVKDASATLKPPAKGANVTANGNEIINI